MTRFNGQALRANCRIAVIANDAIGNFVVATPLLQMLRVNLQPATLDFFSGGRTRELQEASSLIDRSYALWGERPCVVVETTRGLRYDLIVNVEASTASKYCAGILAGECGAVCGPCVAEDGRGDMPFADDERGALWADREWIAPDLTRRYPFLDSGFIGELFCRLCYLEGPVPGYVVPTVEPRAGLPEMLVSTAASLPEKLWSKDGWFGAIDWARRNRMRVGLLGAKPADQAAYWRGGSFEDELVAAGGIEDLRGTLTLPEVAGALARVKVVLTLDNGILHLAAAGGAPIVGLFREGIHRLWAPPAPSVRVLIAEAGRPVSELPLSRVWEALDDAI